MREFVEPIEHLSEMFRRLPGIGRKTAVRLAFSVLDFPEELAREFADAIISAKTEVRECKRCFNMADSELCNICTNSERDSSVLCVVEDARAVIAIERAHTFGGLYHVLHGAISPMKHITPDKLRIAELMERLTEENITEVILATNPTVEGETTAAYLSKMIAPMGIRVSRIANGVPVGGDLEYTDEITLKRALDGRYELD